MLSYSNENDIELYGGNMSYKIVVDSCGEFTKEMKTNSHLYHVPLTLHIGEEETIDDESFNQKEFIEKMAESKECPKSSCPSPKAYMEAYEGEEERGYGVTLSSKLSGSYNSAKLGKDLLEEKEKQKKIHIFDSCSASCGQTQIALKILECEEAGLPFLEVVKEVEEYISQMSTYFVLESLENLRKNGRLTGIKAFVATAMNIKPIMASTDIGEITQLGQARGMEKALKKMIEIIGERHKNTKEKRLAISYCNCQERAQWVKDQFLQAMELKDVIMMDTGGISTLYANDGGIIVAL